MDLLKDILEKIPVGLVMVSYLIHLAYNNGYGFYNNEDSPYVMKQREISVTQEQVQKLKIKIKEVEEFRKNLDAKKLELRKLALDLDSMKGTLSETLDVPEFMRSAITEAKKVGITVLGLKPTESTTREYYAEQSFEFMFRGVYAQLVVFLDRLAKMERIIGVSSFNIKPVSSSSARFVELSGSLNLKAYRYLGSKADELGRDKPSGAPVGTGRGG